MSRPWMPLYVGDLTLDTTDLSAAEYGGYMRLIAHYWAKQCLKHDEAKLQRICGMSADEWEKCRPAISAFFEIRDGQWLHNRIEKELQVAEDKYKRRSNSGRKGGIASGISRSIASTIASSNASSEKEAMLNQPQPQSYKEKIIKKEKSAREVLETCLSAKTAADLIDHRKAKKSPLTVGAAERLVKAFMDFGDPEKAAGAMILNGWQGFNPEWIPKTAVQPASQMNGHATLTQHFIEEESPQWNAWATSYRKTKGAGPPVTCHKETHKRGWWFPAEWPPDQSPNGKSQLLPT